MLSHVTNCCNVKPPELGRQRPACGREELLGCKDVETKGLNNSILDEIWSKPLWYHKRFEVYRLAGNSKPETYTDYADVLRGLCSGFKTTDQFCPYHAKSCNAIFRGGMPTLAQSYDYQTNFFNLLDAVKPEDTGKPCVYPNCWISAAESNKAKCDNKYFRLIAHYPSVGRPFQTPTGTRSSGLRNSNVYPDSEPGREILNYNFDSDKTEATPVKKLQITQGSHDKSIHQNTAYPGKYWISWWNGIHPGNIIGYEGVDIFKNPYTEETSVLKLSDQVGCWSQGTRDSYNCKGITFLQQFEKQAKNKILKISAGWNHTCLLTEDNKCFCWGDTSKNQTAVPVEYTNGKKPVKDINCGGEYTIVTLFDGTVHGWGDNSYGQLNIPTELRTPTTGISVKKIATGGTHVVALMATDKKRNAIRGITVATQNTLRIWGDTTYGKTILPQLATKKIELKVNFDYEDFVESELDRDSEGRPRNPDYSDVIVEQNCIIPWWPLLNNGTETNIYLNGSIYSGFGDKGFLGFIQKYESQKNTDGVFNLSLSKDLEVLDVWAGKDHTVVLTKDIVKVYTKTYNDAYDTLLKTITADTPNPVICGYSPYHNTKVIYGPQLQMKGVVPQLIDYRNLRVIGSTGIDGKSCKNDGDKLAYTKSIVEQQVETNIFAWGKGMQMDLDVTKTSSSIDYTFYNDPSKGRIVRSGDSFPTILRGDDGNYQIKTSPSSDHTIIIGKRQLSLADPTCWRATALHAWGWGDDSYNYIWNVDPNGSPSNDILPRKNLSAIYGSCLADVNSTSTCIDQINTGYRSANCFYYENMFVINNKNINYRLNLYKDGPDNFFQFAYKKIDETGQRCHTKIERENTSEFGGYGCSSSLGGWTFSTELDINETSFDDYTDKIRNPKNSILLRTSASRTYLLERFDDQWTGTPDDSKLVRTCYGSGCGTDNFKSLKNENLEVDFFEAGLNHEVSVQSKNTTDSQRQLLNFPYKITDERPRDRSIVSDWIQNGYISPRITNDVNFNSLKNDTYHQPIFDEQTSSRLKFKLLINIQKVNTKTGNILDSLRIETPNDINSLKLVGLRNDQRVKAFTGATTDCMWSDWATDPFKIGGHPGVIINETIHEGHDPNKQTIPWDSYTALPDRKYRIDQNGVQAINYYNAPPNVLTHNLIEIPPGKFPSDLSLPCRKKFCEGGINRTIKNWCDPCFAYQAGVTLMKRLEAKEVWLGRMGCTGCETNFNTDRCAGCTLQNNQWVCPPTAPGIREVYSFRSPQPEPQINSFGEPSTPLEEAWPSMNRYLIPRWSNVLTESLTDVKNYIPIKWKINGAEISENPISLDYPIVIVPAHGGNIGPKYDLEAYQEIALGAALGSIEEYVNKALLTPGSNPGTFGRVDTGVRYVNDFKDTEYPFHKWHKSYGDYTSPNGSTANIDSKFYMPPTGVTFRSADIINPSTNKSEPMCGDTEVGCSSCAIPFTGAEVAAWGFDLYSPAVVNAVKSFLGLSGDPTTDPEIGSLTTNTSYQGGAWIGIATDRTKDFDGTVKSRLRLMFNINLEPGQVLKFGEGVRGLYGSETYLNGDVKVQLTVDVKIEQYPNDKNKTEGSQKHANYMLRWGRFNDECACSSRVTISPDIFAVDDQYATDTIKKLKSGKISELTNLEKASIIIGGKETKGMGLIQYWNCNNPVTYLESGQSPLLNINGMNVGLCDIDNKKPSFLYETQEYFADGAGLAMMPINTNTYYRGEISTGVVFNNFNGLCKPPTACPEYKLVNSPGIRGIWSGWLSEKGWSNFYTENGGFDDNKDRMGGDIPFEAAHPQGWLGHASAMPHSRRSHLQNERYESSFSISSMSDLVNRLRNVNWYNSGAYEGIASGIDSFFTTGCGSVLTRDTSGGKSPPYLCGGGGLDYNGNRLQIYSNLVANTTNTSTFINPKTQKLKACCFGNGFEHEVYSTVSKSFVPDTYSKIVKINKYRNLYNAMWHSHPIHYPYISFRKWHGDPYSPDYCESGANCKSSLSPVWFDYWWPGVKDEQSRRTVGPGGFNVNRHILHWRHKRWDLPLFIGVNRDNVGNFYIHDSFNCGQFGPENCSGFELVDFSFPSIDPSFHKVGWDHRSYDSIVAQTAISPGALYFFKTDRGASEVLGRGTPIHYTPLPATFYSINSDVWKSNLFEFCAYGPNIDYGIFTGLFIGILDLINLTGNVCFVNDKSQWNNYYTYMGPGFAKTSDRFTSGIINKTQALISNVNWYK